MKKAALINYFNDIDMLQIQVDRGQFDFYDKIYIWDGPYVYTQSIDFMQIGHPRLSDTELGSQLLKDDRVVYMYQVWQDESEKRISAYKAIKEDLVFIHDTDEFFSYDSDEVNRFISSNQSVGFFYCQNLYLNGVHAAPRFYSVDTWGKLPHKGFAFKTSQINPEEHLDYLWLVGVKQNPLNPEKKYKTPIANVYHFTGMRSKKGQEQKFIFYSSLHDVNSGHKNYTYDLLTDYINKGLIDKSQALDIFLNSNPAFKGMHPTSINKSNEIIMSRKIFLECLEPIFEDVSAGLEKCNSSDFLLADGIPRYFFHPNKTTFVIETKSQIQLTVWDLIYGKSPEIRQENFLVNDLTKIESIPDPANIGIFLKLVQSGEKLLKVQVQN